MKSRDLAFGIAALTLSVVYYRMTVAIPETQLADAIGPQGLPTIYAALLATLSLILIVRSVRIGKLEPKAAVLSAADKMTELKAESPGASEPAVRRRVWWRVVGMLGIGVGYIVVVPWLGYVPSLAGLIVAATYCQGGAVNRRGAAVAVSGAVFFWLLFVVLLRIPQPQGFWPSLW